MTTTIEQPPASIAPAGPSRRRVLLTAAGVILALAAAFGGGLLVASRAPADDSAEAGFARDMSTHHGQAVEMATLAMQRADLPQIRTLALDIVLTQQAQIGMMRSWLRQWGLAPTGDGPRMAWMQDEADMDHGAMATAVSPGRDGLMPGMATEDELAVLRESKGPAFDAYFTDLMIRHHAGGITMIDAVLARAPVDQVRELAESMKRGQQNEIEALEQIQTQLRKPS